MSKNVKNKQKHFKEIEQKFNQFNNNGKRTIAIFTDAFCPVVDGVVTVVDNYAKRLCKDFNVVVFAPNHGGKIPEKEYFVVGIKGIFFKKFGYDCVFPNLDFELKKLLKKLRIDIIHLHSPFNAGKFAVKLGKKLKIPVIGTFHSLYKTDFYKQTKSKFLTKILLKHIMRVYNNCTEVWTMNDFAGKMLISYGYRGKIRYVQNSSNFCPVDDAQATVDFVNEKYNLTNEKNVLLYVGRLVLPKNILFLCDCVKSLKDKNFPFKLVVVGSGADEQKMFNKVKELGIENEIVFTGLVNNSFEMQGLFTRADLFVFPSTYDTEGVVKIEAAVCGTPSLVIENTGAASGIVDNVSGYVESLNVKQYSSRIINILNNTDENAKIGQVAKKNLYKSWNQIVLSAESVYNEYIQKNLKGENYE